MEQIKSDTPVNSKSLGISYSVQQRHFPIFGMKKKVQLTIFGVLKHALEKFVTEYQKQFEDLVFMIDGFVLDFSNVNSPYIKLDIRVGQSRFERSQTKGKLKDVMRIITN